MTEPVSFDGLSAPSPAREIPSTFMASLRSWWAAGEKEAAFSEERLLRYLDYFAHAVSLCSFLSRRLPFFRSGPSISSNSEDGLVIAHSERVPLSKPKHYLNTLAIKSTTPSPDAPPPAILLHGYGAGLGFFFLNFPTLAQWAGIRGTSVYAIDWLGMGRSARVPFRIRAKRDDISGRVHEAESFFVESLEEWRENSGLEKMTLIGHSLGAYFSTVYALRYPQRVHKLVLLSPAGVPRDPDATIPTKEILEKQMTGDDEAVEADSARTAALAQEQQTEKRRVTFGRKLLTHLWEEGWSPFQIVRSSLFWGPMLVGKYSSRRFGALNEDETRDMHDYIMNITLAKGSGEYCISHILAPGVHARMPLVDRVSALKMPISFVYGEHDWMDFNGGVASIDNLKAAGNENVRMYIVPRAGHHVYLDNAKAVNKFLLKELNE
ncbi:alpha/beta-hydrolase [Multifurca ochricompacta]|uniref:Alpha/beta-hydrolase n=1 Tax=Multifurca ochricompacta TaxID=376703 RepID=A0AAD4MCJ2_9AGAM|nr:alpha/beta-hydrolase [Multifurca ochricompacta]